MNTAHGALLIVDDDRQSRQCLAARLQRAGHVTAMAENGRQALEMLAVRMTTMLCGGCGQGSACKNGCTACGRSWR
jgi:DNA-binding NtrC family response regulator